MGRKDVARLSLPSLAAVPSRVSGAACLLALVLAALVPALVHASSSDAGTRPSGPRLQLVAKGLRAPLYVTAPRTERDRIYVVQKNGIVRVVQAGRLLAKPFLTLAGKVAITHEMGLLSIAFDPDYATNGLVYAFYSDRDQAINIVQYRAAGSVDLSSARVLIRVPHDDSPYHNGGQLAFGPDGKLYAGIGDGGYMGLPPMPDPHGNSQNLNVLLGKIVRLDPREVQPKPEIVAYGLRNPWRFSFAPSGDLIVGDVGWNGVEEIDVIPQGAAVPVNFGWSVYEGRKRRETDVALDQSGPLTFPALTYETHVQGNCSITAGGVYSGARIRVLRGRYLFGDYCSGRIWSTTITGTAAGPKTASPVRVPQLSSFGTDATGEMYVVSLLGRVYRLVP
jgi:glucose/arabinose dehydrogenase